MKLLLSILIFSTLLLSGCSEPDDVYSKDEVSDYNSSNNEVTAPTDESSPTGEPTEEPTAVPEPTGMSYETAFSYVKQIFLRPSNESTKDENLRQAVADSYGIYGPKPTPANGKNLINAAHEYCDFRLSHEKEVKTILAGKEWPPSISEDLESYEPQVIKTVDILTKCKQANSVSKVQQAMGELASHENDMTSNSVDFQAILTLLSERVQ